jgi:DedD protein
MMWFDKKDETEQPAPRTNSRGRSGDMRSELGLGGSDYTQSNPPSRATRRLGASKSVTQDAAGNTYNEDVLLNDLKVRARRRLIGALVLLAGAFVILPWVFDDSRKQTADVVNVSVPEKQVQFEVQNPRVANEASSSADNLKPVNVKTEPKSPEPSATPVVTASKPADVSVTETAKGKFVVHIGIVSTKADLDALNKRLIAKGAKPVSETITDGGVSKTRVRLGPFDSITAAQSAADKIKGAAKNPVVVEIK